MRNLADKLKLLQAADSIGFDGIGKDGVPGYVIWLAQDHPEAYVILLIAILNYDPQMVISEISRDECSRVMTETAQLLREIAQAQTRHSRKEPESSSEAGQNTLLADLQELAVYDPTHFCRLFCSAFLPRRRRSL